MTSLQTIQQQLLQTVLGGERSEGMIRDNAIADADSRLDVYRHGYRVRLRDALKVEFAGLQCMAGRRLETLLDHYVEAHPSKHYNIRWHGAGMAAFLACAQPWREQPQLAEMARLDWAISTAFDATDEPSVGIADLSSVPPQAWADLRLSLHDNVQALSASYNIETFRRAADHAIERPRLRRHARPRQILVWRHATAVHYRALKNDEWQVLSAALRGESFASLCTRLAACHDEATAMPRMVVLLQTWLQAGFVRGWTVG